MYATRAFREIKRDRLPHIGFDAAGFHAWRDSKLPLTIEIGCGVGLHPISWAKENPQGQMLAIERTSEKFDKFQRRLSNHAGLTNIWPVHGEAAVVLPQILAPNSVQNYFFLYPNPEPQSPNRRLGRSALLKFIFDTLARGGILRCATNVESYARELAAGAAVVGFAATTTTEIPATSAPRSHFEKKYLARGERCWNVICVKSL